MGGLPERGLEPAADPRREELERLRVELSMLLYERDELQMVECKRIEAAYLRRFGPLELRLYETYVRCLRMRRKISLLRASRNRREKPDLAAVEQTLDREFVQYRQELDERVAQFSSLTGQSGEKLKLTPQGRKELRRLYHQIVKRLHPDLHPDISETDLRRFDRAVNAYRCGDLKTLREITTALGEPAEEASEDAAELTRLRELIRTLQEEIAQIKQAYPYRMKGCIENEQRGKERQAALEQQITGYRERLREYERLQQTLLEGEETL